MRNWKVAIRNLRFVICFLLLAAGLLLPATPALADGDPPDPDNNGVVIWNEDYTLEEGKWLDGDLVIFNGDVTLETGSRVEGSVIIWNGSAEVAGTVEGDLVVSNGDIYLDDEARIEGDVVCSWNCDLERKEGSRVDGGIVEGMPLRDLRFERWHALPARLPSLPTLWASGPGQVLGWTLRAMRTVVSILVVAAVAGLVALIWPHQTARIGRAAVEAPGPSVGIGLLTVVAATVLIIALAITICLAPAAVLAALALGAAGLFGWVAIGALVGEQLLRALNTREIAPLWAAGLGTLVITLVSVGLSAAFCLAPLGWLIIFILGCLGLGAVVLTRFGTAAYAPSTLRLRSGQASSGYRPPGPTPPSPVPAPVKAPEPPEPPEARTEEEEELPIPSPPVPTPVEASESSKPPDDEAESGEPPEGEGAEEAESSET